METEIKPCPFCGCMDDPVRENNRHFGWNPKAKGGYDRIETDYYLECNGCELVIGNKDTPDEWGDFNCQFSTRAEAIYFWDTRFNPLTSKSN